MASGRLQRAALSIAVALLSTAAAGVTTAAAANSGGRPNVVIIETDDQTQESIRVMSEVERLLARRGTTFANSFASYPLCCPSRATLLTGQYSQNSGVRANQPPLGGYAKLDSTNTLAVWLQTAGYYTAHIGKYLNGYGTGNPPSNAPTAIPPGWSEWQGSVDPTTYRFYNYTLNERGTLRTFGSDPASYQADVYSSKASELIRQRAPSDQPFFLWTAFLAPHSGGPREPGDPPGLATPVPAPRDRDAFAGEEVKTDASYNEANVSDKPAYVRSRARIRPARAAAIRENYQQRLESLLAVDDAVLAIVRALRDAGELDETLIIFTADNGFFHGEHRIQNGKVWPYEPSVRVPLILRGPDVPRGARREQLVANVDLAPTILDAAGAEAGRLLDGRSLLPLAGSPEVEYGRDILLENGPPRAGATPGAGAPRYAAVRTRRYVYIEYDTGEKELYDLVSDPAQLSNQVSNPGLAAIRDKLAARLARLRGCAGPVCVDPPSLALRLTYQRGEDSRGRTCARGGVRVAITGADAAEVQTFELFVEGDRIEEGDASDLVVKAPRSAFPRGERVKLRARVATTDDRALSLAAHVRACG